MHDLTEYYVITNQVTNAPTRPTFVGWYIDYVELSSLVLCTKNSKAIKYTIHSPALVQVAQEQ